MGLGEAGDPFRGGGAPPRCPAWQATTGARSRGRSFQPGGPRTSRSSGRHEVEGVSGGFGNHARAGRGLPGRDRPVFRRTRAVQAPRSRTRQSGASAAGYVAALPPLEVDSADVGTTCCRRRRRAGVDTAVGPCPRRPSTRRWSCPTAQARPAIAASSDGRGAVPDPSGLVQPGLERPQRAAG